MAKAMARAIASAGIAVLRNPFTHSRALSSVMILAVRSMRRPQAHRVGYSSASQFSREYRRLFGAPPARDIARLKAMPPDSFVTV
jgi:hypothetical protein